MAGLVTSMTSISVRNWVRRGHVVLVGQGLLIDHGRRVPDYIREPLDDLLNDGHLYLGEERVVWSQWPVLATESGQRLHAKLEELRTPPRRQRTIQ